MPYFESSGLRRPVKHRNRGPEVALEWEMTRMAFKYKGWPVDHVERKLHSSLKKFQVVTTEEELRSMAVEISEGRVPPLDFSS